LVTNGSGTSTAVSRRQVQLRHDAYRHLDKPLRGQDSRWGRGDHQRVELRGRRHHREVRRNLGALSLGTNALRPAPVRPPPPRRAPGRSTSPSRPQAAPPRPAPPTSSPTTPRPLVTSIQPARGHHHRWGQRDHHRHRPGRTPPGSSSATPARELHARLRHLSSPPFPRQYSAGAVDITVTNETGTSSTGAGDKFTYDKAPTVTSVSPAAGALGGGTAVTITGTGFDSDALGLHRGRLRPLLRGRLHHHSDTSISATSGGVGARSTSPSPTSPAPLRPAPPRTSSPMRALPHGQRRHPRCGPAHRGHPRHHHRQQLRARSTSPSPPRRHQRHLGGRPVHLRGAPTVSAISPVAGPPGRHLGDHHRDRLHRASAVDFGTGPATSYIVVTSGTQVTATSPAGDRGHGRHHRHHPGGTSATSAADQFTYEAAPTVTAVSPVGRAPGRRHLGHHHRHQLHRGQRGQLRLDCRRQPTPSTRPPGHATSPGRGRRARSTSPSPPRWAPAPPRRRPVHLRGRAPVSAPSARSRAAGGRHPVTITGTGFTGASAVTSARPTPPPASPSTRPPRSRPRSARGAAGTVDVTVTTPAGTSATSSAADQFTYEARAHGQRRQPGGGPAGGGTAVTITGTGFTGASAVRLRLHAATSFTVSSATQVTATSPAGPRARSTSPSPPRRDERHLAADQFTYEAGAPTVSAVSPVAGPLAGAPRSPSPAPASPGPAPSASALRPATSYTVSSATQVTATRRPGAAGTVDVTVTTPSGTSATDGRPVHL
jgi:hypothetical protein